MPGKRRRAGLDSASGGGRRCPRGAQVRGGSELQDGADRSAGRAQLRGGGELEDGADSSAGRAKLRGGSVSAAMPMANPASSGPGARGVG